MQFFRAQFNLRPVGGATRRDNVLRSNAASNQAWLLITSTTFLSFGFTIRSSFGSRANRYVFNFGS
jgi:hypothetical protein